MMGYTVYILAAFVLLSCPMFWKVPSVSVIDTFFAATATISTAGLQPVNAADTYNIGGQCVLLLGIQIGGLGYMTLGSWAILASKRRLTRNRINIGRAVFSMPDSFDPVRFFQHIAIFTISLEIIGTFVLWHAFAASGVEYPLWHGLFHSVASFCTAGVSSFPNGLESFTGDIEVNLAICILSLFGAIGFIVLDDFYRSIRFWAVQATLTTRIILSCTCSAILAGTVLLFFDTHLAELPLTKRLLAAFFHTVSSLTTSGFSTVPISMLTHASLFILIILMILGASPSGTGGGLKSTTWSAAAATITSFMRGQDEVTFFGSKIPHGRLTAAFASIAIYLLAFSLGTYCLLRLEAELPFEDIALEVASALGTVGLSRGITGDLSASGKIVIIVMMFIGRLGVMSLALAAVAFYKDVTPELPPMKDDDIVL